MILSDNIVFFSAHAGGCECEHSWAVDNSRSVIASVRMAVLDGGRRYFWVSNTGDGIAVGVK